MAQPEMSNDTLTLVFSFGFHQKQVNQAANLKLLNDVASEIAGTQILVTAQLQAKLPKESSTTNSRDSSRSAPTATDSPLGDVASIFDGAELVD